MTQPKRKSCKVCGADLQGAIFTSHGVDYLFCKNCQHLNGLYDDTKNFCDFMYMDEGGEDYAANYVDDSYNQRVQDIYIPKAKFLTEVKASLKEKKIIDVGCGGGHFVAALLDQGFNAVGVDVSQKLVEFGNYNIGELHGQRPLTYFPEDSLFSQINGDYDLASTIGVIEHMREPLKYIDEFKKSAVEYIYFSVPMVGPSIIFEHLFQNTYPRQLSAGHTHLFSEQSIEYIVNLAGCESIGEWRFGSDFMDLYRAFDLNLQGPGSSGLKKLSEEKFLPIIDELQSVIDKHHFCSEIHVLAQKK